MKVRQAMLLAVTLILVCTVRDSESQGCESDVILILDGSSTVGAVNFNILKDAAEIFINNTFNDFPNVRIGLMVYGTDSLVSTSTRGITFQSDLITVMRSASFPNSLRNTHAAINEAVNTHLRVGRAGVPKDVVLITVGLATDGPAAVTAANDARTEGITLYALGIESDLIANPAQLDAFRQQLQQIAPSRVTEVQDFSTITSAVGNMPNVLCQVLITVNVNDVTLYTTETIILTATLNQGGIAGGVWSKDGVTLTADPRFSITTESQNQRLTIVNAQLSDSGTYTYTVTGQQSSGTVSVTAGVFSYDRRATSYLGQTVFLSVVLVTPNCNAAGEWRYNLSPLNQGGRFSYTVSSDCRTHTLRIINAQVADSGAYQFFYQGQIVETLLIITESSAPINGGFSEWTTWTEFQCPVTCGTSAQKTITRTRTCDTPFPQNNGANCTGDFSQIAVINCGLIGCPVDGQVTQWGQWNSASVSCPQTCGTNAVKTAERRRTCTAPRPQNGGRFCSESLYERRSESCAFNFECPTPVDGGVSDWEQWIIPACSVTCGITATRVFQRFRTCTNPAPSPGGLQCQENLSETAVVNCGLIGCPVDGGVSQWGEWNTATAPCPLTCGISVSKTVQRIRRCDSPLPQNGGRSCTENLVETRLSTCSVPVCTTGVNGGVGQWSAWNTASVACPVTCGLNALKNITRRRACDSPPPSNGGRDCLDHLAETTLVNCGLIGCPINGGISEWGAWNSDRVLCPFTCGVNATKQVERVRRCNAPIPSNGGLTCTQQGIALVDQTFVRCNTPACAVPVNGGVSQWGAWADLGCAVTCGNAFKNITRSRTCTNPVPANGGIFCTRPLSEVSLVSCGLIGCPVNGQVGQWSQWSSAQCSLTCGTGVTGRATRSRQCNRPPPSNGGRFCSESLSDTTFLPCNLPACPVPIDGGVSQWEQWSQVACSVTCGTTATKNITRVRFCNTPFPSNGGRTCQQIGFSLSQSITVNCGLLGCPINGGLSAWGQWSIPACTASCGLSEVRTITRFRFCNNPTPQNGGRNCALLGPTDDTALRSCELPACPGPVDGGLSQWSTWTSPNCAQTCGASLISLVSRVRQCNSPVPRNGGRNCEGNRLETQLVSCGLPNCPRDGGLSQWTQWTAVFCTVTCGAAQTTTVRRFRSCTAPTPADGGRDCTGLGETLQTQQRSCNLNPCPIDGGLGNWNQWNIPNCGRTCGSTLTLTATRVRFCNNPTPQFGGRNCSLLGSLEDSQIRNCGLPRCPINGGLSQWTQWNVAPCTLTCGISVTTSATRFRSCTNPPPADGGRDCTGLGATSETQTRSCGVNRCPINGGLSQWSLWSVVQCTATCGINLRTSATRTRTCTSPVPQFGGRDCAGLGDTQQTESRSCNLGNCPIDGGLGQWNQWSIPSCQRTCGSTLTATASRVRFCDSPTPQFGGRNCSGLGSTVERQGRNCGLPSCPTDGGLSQWSLWNVVPCTLTCGSSVSTSASRFRTCTNPVPADGGRDCTGLGATNQTEVRSCSLRPCPINGGLSQWSQWNVVPCVATCGPSLFTSASRFRTCTAPLPQFGGRNCSGLGDTSQTQARGCNLGDCPIHGGLTQWSSWNIPGCLATCGSGETRRVSRSRTCTSPVPQFGGRQCSGPTTDSFVENCGLPSCARDGGISQWTAWVEPQCVITCGTTATFIAYRQRFCNNPSPRDGGRNCTESRWDTQRRNCGLASCPLHGGLSQWTQWSGPACQFTCGRTRTRVLNRVRFCNSPTPAFGGRNCTGPTTQQDVRNCELPACPIDGNVGQWSQWSVPPCPRTCGSTITRTVSRVRFCNTPYPQNGGRNCTQSLYEEVDRNCGLPRCTVDGGFNLWTQWSLAPCGRTCGINVFTSASRFRTCTNPIPTDGGRNCSGEYTQTTTRGCNLNNCPIDGGLSQWNQWSVPSCILTCGTNKFVTAHRSRSCTQPIPRFGGRNCTGIRDETQARSCNLSPCPVDGGVTQWTGWTGTPCTRTCGTSATRTVSRTRTCINPPPANGGRGCVESLYESETRSCGFTSCPIHGGISQWTQWSDQPCPITCGPSARKVVTRTRVCNSPVPAFGGRFCNDSVFEYEVRSCGLGNCPIDGDVTPWSQWSEPACPVTCGNNPVKSVFRFRTCTNPRPLFGGRDCTQLLNESTTIPCGVPRCPINGGFSQWSAWNDPLCPVTCGTAASKEVVRTRSCSNPVPQNGGDQCTGDVREVAIRACNLPRCPVRIQGLCANAQIVNGVGYRYHPTDCDKYIQCYYSPSGYVIGAYRSCPFGYYWDQRTLRCDQPWRVDCPLEKCDGNCVANYNLEGSCRAHWVCDKGVSRADCCPMGFRYVVGQGCRPDFYCRDTCPTPCASRDICDKRPDWNDNPRTYNISVGLLGWLSASCVSGAYFDLLDCGCGIPSDASCQPDYSIDFTNSNALDLAKSSWMSMTDISILNGNARFNGIGHVFVNITQKAPATDCPLIIRFRFTETQTVTSRRILASTSDCYKANTLVIALEQDSVIFEMRSVFGQMFRMPVSLAGFSNFEWKTVTMVYDGKMMTGIVESSNLKYMQWLFAPEISLMECGMRFGSDGSMSSSERFVGSFDMFSIYRCNPGGLY